MLIMQITEQIAQIEKEAKSLNIPISKICKNANIATSTYQRWKRGQNSPQMTTFDDFNQAFTSLKGEGNA